MAARGVYSDELIQVTGFTQIVGVSRTTLNLTPASVAATISAAQTFTMTGAIVGDVVTVCGPTPTAGTGIVNAQISAANTLQITFFNVTVGALVPAAGNYQVMILR